MVHQWGLLQDTGNVLCLATDQQHLFSGGMDYKIRKWSVDPLACVGTFAFQRNPNPVAMCLLVWNGNLYSSCNQGDIRRSSLDGEVLQVYSARTTCATVWRGAVFSSGFSHVIQWTSFPQWSTMTH